MNNSISADGASDWISERMGMGGEPDILGVNGCRYGK